MQATASNHYVSSFYHLAEKLAALLTGIWDALQDEGMSLTGARVPRDSFYMVGKLTVHEPNLKKVERPAAPPASGA
jgi:hypothetical protein